MEINRITAAVTLVLAMVVLSSIGINIVIILYYAIIVVPIVYLLILTKRYVDAKESESKISTDLTTKIVLLKESMGRIEKKVEKIESILEKVSE
ncbi:hypothetical protein METP2_01038 [Methanosarcinales archaeon]|nr:hypothetical protein [Candidatus Methanoperedens sp.]CAG0965086.1 hypothetical protein METP2_01038 [Methanosarcinales archaeon]